VIGETANGRRRTTDPPSLLTGYRALDLSGPTGWLCGKLFADLGAAVLKVEPPGGDPGRRRPPFYEDAPDPERSLAWLAHNTGKRGLTLDWTTAGGRAILTRLAATADLLIETEKPGRLAAYGLTPAAFPQLVWISITPFGQTGPYSRFEAEDLVATALGGNSYQTGDPDRPPLNSTIPTSYYHAGAEAAAAGMVALFARAATGRGRQVDVSLQSVIVGTIFSMPATYALTGREPERRGAIWPQANSLQREIWACRDGYISFALRGGPQRAAGLRAAVEWMEAEGMAPPYLKEIDWLRFDHTQVNQAEFDRAAGPFEAFFKTRTLAELTAAAHERGILLAPVNSPRELYANPQLRARDFFVTLDHPEYGRGFEYPGPFTKLLGLPVGPWRRAPRIGEHNREVYGGELGYSREELTALAAAGVI
jgi:crotonobetainyl-CoA:carnitine CoA-transferase CaiB-like acyl-CoA transferase